MTTSTCKIICITNRNLCVGDYFERIEALAKARPDGIILREKDLTENEYRSLAIKAMDICRGYGTACILHSFADTALELGAAAIHVPMGILESMTGEVRRRLKILGVSCHSVRDAVRARDMGCTCVTAGHVFDTDCKSGLPGRGTEFLREVCGSVPMPVYAIGGIEPENIRQALDAGAAGVCVMSGAMTCRDPGEYIAGLREAVNEIH